MQIKEETGIEQTCDDHRRGLLQSVSGESRGNQGVIMRPDRSIVIGHGIVSRLAAPHRTNAPTGERCFVCEGSRYTTSVLLCRDTGEKTVPRVRCAHSARSLAAIQCKSVSGKLITPKCLPEAATERFRLSLQLARACCVPKHFCKLTGRGLRGVNITLHFAKRDW